MKEEKKDETKIPKSRKKVFQGRETQEDQFVRSEELQNESFPNFSNFRMIAKDQVSERRPALCREGSRKESVERRLARHSY